MTFYFWIYIINLYNSPKNIILYLYLLYYIFKTLFNFIFYYLYIRSKNKNKESKNENKKTYINNCTNLILITSFIDFCLISNFDSLININYFDNKFLYLIYCYYLSSIILKNQFYIQHKIGIFIIFISSLIQFLNCFFSNTLSINNYPYILLYEMLFSLKEILEKYMMKKNETNFFYILTLQGYYQIIFFSIYIFFLFILKDELYFDIKKGITFQSKLHNIFIIFLFIYLRYK